MKPFAQKTMGGNVSRQNKPTAEATSGSPLLGYSSHDQPVLRLQRKATCACGGGCPSCHDQERRQSIQTKLAVSTPGDPYEQEADRVAEKIMRMPEPSSAVGVSSAGGSLHSLMGRKCSPCAAAQPGASSEGEEVAGEAPHVAPKTQGQIDALCGGGGQSLTRTEREFFEPRFGHSFSDVRVHTDVRAAELARAVNAQAYTVGRDIVFGDGQYAPQTTQGRLLLAHELTHVVQQRDGVARVQRAGDCRTGGRDEDHSEAKWAFQHDGQIWGFASTDKAGPADSNELTLWNYCVGEATPRPEHRKHLLAQVQRWRSLLLAGTGEHRLGTDARIRITGTASASGDPGSNQQLALRRAQEVRDLLEINGIPNMLFDVVSLGSRFPLADESETEPNRRAENMARNRRVEVTFYVPTKAVDDLGLSPADMPVITGLRFKRNRATHVVMGPEIIRMTVGVRDVDATVADPPTAGAAAVAQASNVRRDVSVGFLQLLMDDSRSGIYHPVPDPQPLGGSGARDLTVDLSPCVKPFLPCRDVEESTHRFSFDVPGRAVNGNRASSGQLAINDAPGHVWSRHLRDSGGGRWEFRHGVWAMKFVVLLGVFRGELGLRPGSMQILQHAHWEFFVELDPILGIPQLQTSGDDSFKPGAPSGLDLQAATTGQTCRMILRSTNLEDPTSGARPCRGRESVGPRSPI